MPAVRINPWKSSNFSWDWFWTRQITIILRYDEWMGDTSRMHIITSQVKTTASGWSRSNHLVCDFFIYPKDVIFPREIQFSTYSPIVTALVVCRMMYSPYDHYIYSVRDSNNYWTSNWKFLHSSRIKVRGNFHSGNSCAIRFIRTCSSITWQRGFLCHRATTLEFTPSWYPKLVFSTNIPFQAQSPPFQNCVPSQGFFPSPLTVYTHFDSCYSHCVPYRMTPSVRHRATEVHYYYNHFHWVIIYHILW